MATPRHKVFVSYSHRDRRHLERLRVHLRPLERAGIVDLWDDTRLDFGAEWEEQIAGAIQQAKVAVLLVSADFLASKFIVDNELPPLLAAARTAGTVILPVIVSACRLERNPDLSRFQAANDPSRPLANLPVAERERIWVRVASAVEASLQDRAPAEGWAVLNERRVLESLNELINCPRGSFLIVSSGDQYVQFIWEKDALYCEAVSNNYLPEKLQLSDGAKQKLIRLGFQVPNLETENYRRRFSSREIVKDCGQVARLVIQLMSDVYEVSQNNELSAALTVEEP